jgi:acyl carrier protein
VVRDSTTPTGGVLVDLLEILNRIVGVDRGPVTPESRLFADLALDSFDLMELAVAVEDRTGRPFGLGDIAEHVQGSLDEPDFVGQDGRLTPAGWQQARDVMPQIPADMPQESRYPLMVVGHFSIRNLADLIASGAPERVESVP